MGKPKKVETEEKSTTKKTKVIKAPKQAKYQRVIFKGENARNLLKRRGSLATGEKAINVLDIISRIFVGEIGRKGERLLTSIGRNTLQADDVLFTVKKRMNMDLVSFAPPKHKTKKVKEAEE